MIYSNLSLFYLDNPIFSLSSNIVLLKQLLTLFFQLNFKNKSVFEKVLFHVKKYYLYRLSKCISIPISFFSFQIIPSQIRIALPYYKVYIDIVSNVQF